MTRTSCRVNRPTPEGFLRHRSAPLAGTHVDTISWSVLGSWADAPVYDSKVQPFYGDAHGGPPRRPDRPCASGTHRRSPAPSPASVSIPRSLTTGWTHRRSLTWNQISYPVAEVLRCGGGNDAQDRPHCSLTRPHPRPLPGGDGARITRRIRSSVFLSHGRCSTGPTPSVDY